MKDNFNTCNVGNVTAHICWWIMQTTGNIIWMLLYAIQPGRTDTEGSYIFLWSSHGKQQNTDKWSVYGHNNTVQMVISNINRIISTNTSKTNIYLHISLTIQTFMNDVMSIWIKYSTFTLRCQKMHILQMNAEQKNQLYDQK